MMRYVSVLAFVIMASILLAFAHDHGHGGHDHGHGGHDHGHGGHDHGHGGHDHGHNHGSHGHDEPEHPPSHKYTKKANTAKKADPHHGHQHGAAKQEASHGHAHGGVKEEAHGHAHGGKPCSHSHGGKAKPSVGHAHGPPAGAGSAPPKKPTGKSTAAVQWYVPLLATAAISAAPFLILFLVPLDSNCEENQPFLRLLLAFASGGLLGDAFLHLIPHAISPHSHDGSEDSHEHSHSHGGEHDHTGDMLVGLWVLAGLMTFLVVEKVVLHVKGHSHGHSHGGGGDDGAHSQGEEDDENKKDTNKEENEVPASKDNESEDNTGLRKRKLSAGRKDKSSDASDAEQSQHSQDEDSDKEKEHETEVTAPAPEVHVSAYLNLAADCTHNFTDGLAIAASFLIGHNVGLITTLTIFLHEIPHEIGDFAILIRAGCTKKKAMLLQLVTAGGAFAGCICGLLAEGMGSSSSWILPFTAGGFIYIATVTVIPELLKERNFLQSVKQIIALLVGVGIMVIIAITE